MMKYESISLFGELCNSQDFMAALDDFVQHETAQRIDILRAAARNGNVVASAMIEGEISALEELPSRLRIISQFVP